MCDKPSKRQHGAKKARVDQCRTQPRINDELRAKNMRLAAAVDCFFRGEVASLA